MSIVTPSDFTDRFAITKAYNGSSKIQEYIDLYEKLYMAQLLGADLYATYLTEIAQPSPLPIYVKLRDAFIFNRDGDDKLFFSNGIRHMLKCFIYTHYRRGDLSTATSGGNITLTPEGGQRANDKTDSSFNEYNDGIKTYQAIQAWIEENKEDYPTYKGKPKRTSWFI